MVIKAAMQSKGAIMTDTAGTAGGIMSDMDTVGLIMTDSGIGGSVRANPEMNKKSRVNPILLFLFNGNTFSPSCDKGFSLPQRIFFNNSNLKRGA
jgi:hypothetical protein